MAGKLIAFGKENLPSKGLGYVEWAEIQEWLTERMLGIGREKEGKGRRLGQNLGTLAGDLVADNTRNFYWLLNAAQATGNVIAES